MQAVILAGGKGTRLSSRLRGRPKPLIDIDGVPLLERQIRQLAAHGVDEALILVNHAADQIADFLAGRDFGCRLTLIDDGEPRGTAGATLACHEHLRDRFLVVYGDTLFDIDIAAMVAAHVAAGAEATLLLHPNDHPADSDLVAVDDDGWIVAFYPYPHAPGVWLPNLVNAAFYVVERRLLDRCRSLPLPSDFAKDLFPAMVGQGARLRGYRSFEYIKDIGTPTRLDKAERHLRAGVVERARRSAPQPTVFVDRDTALSALREYPCVAEDWSLAPGVAEAVRRLNDREIRVAIIGGRSRSSQAEEVRRINARLETELGEGGAYVDRLYEVAREAPADPTDQAVNLIARAAAEMTVDHARSFMVSDRGTDVSAARRCGICSVLVRTPEGGREHRSAVWPDFVVEDLPAAIDLILHRYPKMAAHLSNILDRVSPGDLVLIGGLARSGKSTAAAVMAATLRAAGVDNALITLDRWIRPLEDRKDGLHGRFDLDGALAALGGWLSGGGEDIALGGYNRFTRSSGPGGALSVRADTVLLLEGVPALDLFPQTQRRIHRLFVECDEAGRHRRVVADLIARGSDPAEAESLYESRQHDEAPLVQASRRAADHVLRLDIAFQSPPEASRDH